MTATRDADVDAVLLAAKREPDAHSGELLELLAEDAPLYAGRSAAAAGWIRAWLMAQFADIGLPSQALPLVLEVLHTDLEPRALAAAAVASRGLAAPSPETVAGLLAALKTLQGRDEAVDLQSRHIAPARPGTSTAALEVLSALRWQPSAGPDTADVLDQIQHGWSGAWAPRVQRAFTATITALRARRPAAVLQLGAVEPSETPHPEFESPARDATGLESVVVEDQAGTKMPLHNYFSRANTIVAFFYTRCQNPNKCSATITKLAQLQQDLAAKAPNTQVAAITYDPGYDSPDRLLRYGIDRGYSFTNTARMFRAVVGHIELQTFFGLLVGYNGPIVNRHSLELFLVDTDCTVVKSWPRVQWQLRDVVGAIITHHGRRPTSDEAQTPEPARFPHSGGTG